MPRVLAAALLFAIHTLGCTTARPPGTPGTYESILLKLCPSLIAEQLGPEQEVYFLAETQPIIDTFSLRLLYDEKSIALATIESDDARDATYRRHFRSRAISLEKVSSRCNFVRASEDYDKLYGENLILVQLSGRIKNPFIIDGAGSRGYFARISLGGRAGASWYWLEMAGRAGGEVAEIYKLEISDG